MADAVAGLTEKEKEALRLLLAGHDAKSAALELGISVHTLNDRLRAARRKLGVTTSKEAARVLSQAGQSTEDTPPKSFVHKPLGVHESEENQHIPTIAQGSESGLFHLAGRWKGVVIMSLVLALSLTAAAVFYPAQPPQADRADITPQTEFVAERPSPFELQARRWLGLIDAGLFDESYEEAGETLREQYSPGLWELGMAMRRTKGELEDRSLASLTRTGEFGGREGSEFVVIIFDTLFEYNNRQIERVVLEKVGARWQVIDYEITPAQGESK